MLGKFLESVKERKPLVHSITNYVTVNDVANVILASGAKPIMSSEPTDIEEVTSISNALNINMGTLTTDRAEAMIKAGKRAKELGIPVVLDPVGVGISAFRSETAQKILDEVGPTVVRGNITEIKALSLGSKNRSGVDAASGDEVGVDNIREICEFVDEFAKNRDCIVVVTGETDIVSNGKTRYLISNGCAKMSEYTGSGCQLSGLIGAFLGAAGTDDSISAVAAAVCTLGLAGEIALTYMQKGDGNATYRNRVIDAVYNMTGNILNEGARYEVQ